MFRVTDNKLKWPAQPYFVNRLHWRVLWTGQIPPKVIFPLKELHLALEDQVKRITSLESQNRKPLRKIFKAGSLMQSMNGVRTCISEALSRFATSTNRALSVDGGNNFKPSQYNSDELSKLPKVNAEYYRVESKSECLKTTRDKIRSSILEYLRDPKNRFVWLHGSPGMGKTAISMSVASTLDKQHTLAASFFWDKNQEGTGLDSISCFPSTLARQLAAFNAEYQNSLIRQLWDPASFSSIDGSPLEKEVKARIINPMHELGGLLSSGKGHPVIVLDGLDECGNPEALASLMRLILLLDELPLTFAILVSCHPEPQVICTWAWARANPHLSIAHEDMDQIAEDKNFHTIHCMVEKGLQDCIMESPWKPTKKDLDAFSSACCGLPIIASTRIRDVHVQTQSGSKSEFDYYLNLTDAPQGLNEEYLQIMRRAYLRQYPKMNSRITEKYREVVGMVIAARKGLSVCDISQLLRTFTEHEVYSTLKPISSIVNLPSKNKRLIKFYHAMVKEFITGNPIGKEEDKVFFISDKNGYSFGLRLLRLVNGAIERNEWGLRDMNREKRPNYVYYAFKHLFQHLDPLLLFLEESNELQREYEQFWKQNLLSFFGAGGGVIIPHNWSKSHKSTSIICAAISLFGVRSLRVVYRLALPFTPKSSPVYKFDGHLSDPVQVFSVSSEFAGGFIPLSKDTHRARKVMEVELTKLPKVVNEYGKEAINYEAEFLNDNVRNGIVTCAALSRDGHHIALGFGSGVIEIANIDNQCTISRFQSDLPYPPVWIKFIHGSNVHIATEDTHGNVSILGNGMPSVKLGPLPSSRYPPVTVVLDNGSFIIRVPQNAKGYWYKNTAVLRVSGNPSIQLLTPPTLSSWSNSNHLSLPQRHLLGFSPTGRYVCASDGHVVFVWSTDSGEFIAEFRSAGLGDVIINTGIVPSCSFLTLNTTFHQPAFPLILGEDTQPVSRDDSDESWLECPCYDLSPSMTNDNFCNYSSAAGKVPLIYLSIQPGIWFNGNVNSTSHSITVQSCDS
ncbi:uncharacterized protein EI90DRAFT_3174464 [Cantharellus anzutake]|uniref:uncharacterized protein n=1 Tax=Cantharellus anzutake TaxID=1750568 RepID=UPI0019066572|nr:uncharacterized protein EI90DRAFT_3174464 [Cantharellus anzutake]KAF8335427.1 hypothetical protein EI90DRAFT_3174464 [Cantharellus anzutake]